MKNTLLNHDCFNTWQTCRKRFFYKYIKELKFPEFNLNYELGKSVHSLIDYHLRGLKTDHLLETADEDISERWQAVKNHPVMNKKVINTEWAFNIPVKDTGYRLIGRIDAIFFDEETNKYIIADWKTGKFIPKKILTNFQHKIYLYSLYHSRKDLGLDFKPEDLSFQYFKILPGSVDDSTIINFSEEKMLEYEESIVSILQNIDAEADFPVPSKCPLKTCQFQSLCKM